MPSLLCNRRRDNGSERRRILHNVCKFPMPILENSVANITANISYVRYINLSSLIRNVLKRRRECGTYLATARRHRRRLKMQKRDE